MSRTPAVAIVVAMDRHRLIGAGGGLPWHLPDDLKRFRAITMGHPILMGRRTWESLGRPLPGRHNIVVTRQAGYVAPGATVVASLDAALTVAAGEGEAMVIGGATLYAESLPRARRVYLTEVDGVFIGDTWFPALEADDWREVAREPHPADARHACAFSFVVLERASPATGIAVPAVRD